MSAEQYKKEIKKIQTEKAWTKKCEKILLGQKIVKVEYMSEQDAKDMGWDSRPIQILLSNGVWLTPQSDDEGNDGGSIGTNHENPTIIPVI
jgi:hypothetical protein